MIHEDAQTPPFALVIIEFPYEDAHSRQIQSMLSAGAVVLVARSQAAARSWISENDSPPQRSQPAGLDVEIDLAGHRARCSGAILDLTEQEFLLLGALAENRPDAVSYELLSQRVWGRPGYGDLVALRSAVKRLRRKLESAGASIMIEAVRGFGFRLEAILPGEGA